MLLILVLALLFFPSLAEEELRGVKQKNMLIRVGHTIWKYTPFSIKKGRPFHFGKRPTPKFYSFWSAIPIMIFLPPEGKVLPFWAGCGRGGIRTPDTVVRSHVL